VTGLQFSTDVLYALTQWIGEPRVNSLDEAVDMMFHGGLYLIFGCFKVFQQLQLRYLPTYTFFRQPASYFNEN